MNQRESNGGGRAITRRELLQAGSAGALGLGLSALAASDVAAATRPDNGMSCIFVYLWGAPSHYETFDPKPDLPAEVRSRYGAISTSVDGVRICEHLPRLARQAHLYTLIRSMRHEISTHAAAGHFAMTGTRPAPGLEAPNHGAVLAKLLPPRSELPTFVRVGKRLRDEPVAPTGQDGGFLGAAYRPLEVPDATLPPEKIAAVVTPAAYRLALTSSEAGRAFDLTREREPLRERYGATEFGRNCLLARRLVQSGPRYVQVNWSGHPVRDQGWDSHGTSFGGAVHQLHEYHLPVLDQGLSALIDDLHVRGMLEKTLLVVTGEFGRTLRVNRDGGRDHWPGVYTSMLLGAGLRGGRVIGASDAHGMYPDGDAVTPEDMTAEIYRLLGVDVSNVLRTAQVATDAPGIRGLRG